MKTVLAFLLVFNIFASDEDKVHSMLQQWQKAGVIDQGQLKDAMKRLKRITPQQWQKIKRVPANTKISRNRPVSNTLNSATQNIDLASPEFQKIQKQIQNILNN